MRAAVCVFSFEKESQCSLSNRRVREIERVSVSCFCALVCMPERLSSSFCVLGCIPERLLSHFCVLVCILERLTSSFCVLVCALSRATRRLSVSFLCVFLGVSCHIV